MVENKLDDVMDSGSELSDLHPDHEKHLCHITSLRNMKTVGVLSKDAQHLCVICGRAAKRAVNLCEPAKI